MSPSILTILVDLMRGGRHSRTTVARSAGVSMPTADRWLAALAGVPGIRKVRVGKVSWFEWNPPKCHACQAKKWR